VGSAFLPRNYATRGWRLGSGSLTHSTRQARAAKAGVPVISVHATRRTCASLLVALDVHPRVAMDIYSQVSSASTRLALKRLGSQLGEGSA